MAETASDRWDKFATRVEILQMDELSEIGLTSDSANGIFFPEKIPSLLEWCANNPRYHIISLKDKVHFNCFVEDAKWYYVGAGSNDPNLKHVQEQLSREDFEQMRDSILAVSPEKRLGAMRIVLAWAEAVLGGAEAFDARTIMKIVCRPCDEKTAEFQSRNSGRTKYLA
jgi:hypothetical protein